MDCGALYVTEILIGIVATIVGIAVAYFKGRKDADTANEVDDYNEYVATRNRMDAIDPVDDHAEWLRKRAKRKGDL